MMVQHPSLSNAMWMGNPTCPTFNWSCSLLLFSFTSCGFQLAHESLIILHLYMLHFPFLFTWVFHHFQLKPMSFLSMWGILSFFFFFLHWSDTKPNLTPQLQTKALVSGCWVSIIFLLFLSLLFWWGQAMGTGLGSWMQHWWKRFEIVEKTCYLQKDHFRNYILFGVDCIFWVTQVKRFRLPKSKVLLVMLVQLDSPFLVIMQGTRGTWPTIYSMNISILQSFKSNWCGRGGLCELCLCDSHHIGTVPPPRFLIGFHACGSHLSIIWTVDLIIPIIVPWARKFPHKRGFPVYKEDLEWSGEERKTLRHIY